MMRWSSMKYLTKQGLSNMRANRLMTLASIGVLSVCLMITGAAMLFTMNVESLVAYLGSQNETVVYLDPQATDEEIGFVYDAILAVSGVREAHYVSKESVLETYRDSLEEYSDIWGSFEDDNPFKANYRVVITDLENMQSISDELAAIEHVYKVYPPVEMANIFVDVQSVVSNVGYVLIAILAIVSLVVIGNTIGLSVYARRKEINVMKYVGATDAFIRWPFFVEGVVVGLVASIVALGAILGIYALLVHQAENLTGFWQTLLGASVVPIQQVWFVLLRWFMIGGVVVGGLGSVTSIRKHLNV